ncbi:Mov34/MPN/PAD-1 family protein [Cohnella boryungensis]|uniref:Mov34/MPN/PAD-1 family protein n=1 Tax=Cohnella boryungensis TaxID=768479 RepID=A0ABV8SFQ7_9BACL
MGLALEIRLEAELEERLVETLRARLPYEACGIIYGREEDGIIVADGFALIANDAARSVNAFAFRPEEWVRLYCEAQKNQRCIVGLFHSHPQRNAWPSEADLEGSLPWGTYWIVGFFGGDPANYELAVYRRASSNRWLSLAIQRAQIADC